MSSYKALTFQNFYTSSFLESKIDTVLVYSIFSFALTSNCLFLLATLPSWPTKIYKLKGFISYSNIEVVLEPMSVKGNKIPRIGKMSIIGLIDGTVKN